MHDDAVPLDVGPDRSTTAQLPGGVVLIDFEDFDPVAGELVGLAAPGLEVAVPAVVVVADVVRSDDEDVDVAIGLAVAPGEGAVHNHAGRLWSEGPGISAELVEDGGSGPGQIQEGPSGNVVGHEPKQHGRRDVASSDEAEFNQSGHDPGGLGEAHSGEAGDRPQIELGGRPDEHGEYAALGSRDQRLKGSGEVHPPTLSLIYGTIVSFLSDRRPRTPAGARYCTGTPPDRISASPGDSLPCMKLTDSELAFLERNHSAAMVTLNSDGIPKIARVGVALIEGKLWSSGTADRVRTKRLRADPRCTLYVHDNAFGFLVLETAVAILDGPDADALNLRLFRVMQGKPTGPLSWFGGEYEEEDFLAHMRAEQRLIYEFEPHHTYGLH